MSYEDKHGNTITIDDDGSKYVGMIYIKPKKGSGKFFKLKDIVDLLKKEGLL